MTKFRTKNEKRWTGVHTRIRGDDNRTRKYPADADTGYGPTNDESSARGCHATYQ